MTDQPRVLLVQSDQHVGSTVAPCPFGHRYITDDGEREVPRNLVMDWLTHQHDDCWAEAKSIIGDDPWVYLSNGDAIEGFHHGGEQIWGRDASSVKSSQIHAINALLEPHVAAATHRFFTRGTSCHVNNAEHDVGAALGGEKDDATGLRCSDHWPIEFCGVPMSARHHITTTSRKHLEASALSIHLRNEQNSAFSVGWPVPRLCIRSHRHVAGVYDDGHSMMLVTHAWQLATRYVHKVCTGSETRVGLHLLDWRNRDNGELPEVRAIYRTPKPRKTITL